MKQQTQGTIDKVTKGNNGWYSIIIDGEKFSTKLEKLAKQAFAAVGQVKTFEFTESEKPKDDGSGVWKNLYFEGIVADPAPAQEIPVETQHQREPSPEAQGRMARFSSVQTAAILLASPRCTVSLDGNNLIDLAEWIEAYGVKGRAGVRGNWLLSGSNEQQVIDAVEKEFGSNISAPPASDPDDIPFLWEDAYGIDGSSMSDWRDPWRQQHVES